MALASVLAAAEPDPVAIEMTATPAAVEVGKEVAIAILWRWPKGWTPRAEPDLAALFADELVIAFPPVRATSTGQEERRSVTLTVLARRSGAWVLPRPVFTVAGASGEVGVQAAQVVVQVGASASPAQLPPPRPLWTRAQATAPLHRRWWPYAIAAVVVGGALALLLRRRHGAPAATPWQVFERDLASVGAAPDGKEAGHRLSLALRRWAGATWRFDGPGATTRELAARLRAVLPADEHQAIVRLLDQLDALRWAADDLPPGSVLPLADDTRRWAAAVETRLRAAAEAAAARKPVAANLAST